MLIIILLIKKIIIILIVMTTVTMKIWTNPRVPSLGPHRNSGELPNAHNKDKDKRTRGLSVPPVRKPGRVRSTPRGAFAHASSSVLYAPQTAPLRVSRSQDVPLLGRRGRRLQAQLAVVQGERLALAAVVDHPLVAFKRPPVATEVAVASPIYKPIAQAMQIGPAISSRCDPQVQTAVRRALKLRDDLLVTRLTSKVLEPDNHASIATTGPLVHGPGRGVEKKKQQGFRLAAFQHDLRHQYKAIGSPIRVEV